MILLVHRVYTCEEDEESEKLSVYRPDPHGWMVEYIAGYNLHRGYDHHKEDQQAYYFTNLLTTIVNHMKNRLYFLGHH